MERKEIIFKSRWVRYVGMLAIGSSLTLFSCDNSGSNNSNTRTGHDNENSEMVEEGQGAGANSDMSRSSSETDPSLQEGVGSGTMGGESNVGTDEMRGAGTVHRGSGTSTTDMDESAGNSGGVDSNNGMQSGQGAGSESDMIQGAGGDMQQNKQPNKSKPIGADTDLNNNVGEGKYRSDTLGDHLEGPRDPARGAGTGAGTGMGTGAGTWKGTAVDTMATELYNDSL